MAIIVSYKGQEINISNERAEELLSEIESDLLELGENYIVYAIFKSHKVKVPFIDDYIMAEFLEDYCLHYNDLTKDGLDDNEQAQKTTLKLLYERAKKEAEI